MNISEYSVTVARDASSIKEWFDSAASLKIYPSFPPERAIRRFMDIVEVHKHEIDGA